MNVYYGQPHIIATNERYTTAKSFLTSNTCFSQSLGRGDVNATRIVITKPSSRGKDCRIATSEP